jgi:hypothetical protein
MFMLLEKSLLVPMLRNMADATIGQEFSFPCLPVVTEQLPPKPALNW